MAVLKGIPFDDLDEGADDDDRCESLTHGPKPVVKNFADANEEADYLLSEIEHLHFDEGVRYSDICIMARTNKLVDSYSDLFNAHNVKTYKIKRSRLDNRSFDGLRVATLHRVAGLEFQYVFIVAVNNVIVPLTSAIDTTDPISEKESYTSEKCLLYVGLSRAQKGAYITSYGKKSEFLQ